MSMGEGKYAEEGWRIKPIKITFEQMKGCEDNVP